MTPLAKMICEDRVRSVSKRTFRDQCGLLALLPSAMQFDVSDVFASAGDGARAFHRATGQRGVFSLSPVMKFLPSASTWIEWAFEDGAQEGVLLRQMPGQDFCRCYWAFLDESRKLFLSASLVGALPLNDILSVSGEFPNPRPPSLEETTEARRGYVFILYALLSIINSPRTIGRITHSSDSALQKMLRDRQVVVGKFPLHAWTEIKLRAGQCADMSGQHVTARYTGMMPWEKVRAHIQWRRGVPVFINEYERGNPAMGMRRQRYRVLPERRGRPPALPGSRRVAK